ncbi:MAG: hypothetical protein AB7O88_02730 [Reyranellaceae bacterium]
MDWDVIRSRILVFLVADGLGFAIFWINRAIGTPSGRFEEIMLLTLGVSNGIIIFAALAGALLMIPVVISRTFATWFG